MLLNPADTGWRVRKDPRDSAAKCDFMMLEMQVQQCPAEVVLHDDSGQRGMDKWMKNKGCI